MSKSDTAVIFFHGVPFNASFWSPVIERLSIKHRCYSLNLKGFGESADDANLEDFSLLAQLDWLENLVNKIPEQNYIFVMHGWSSVPATMLAQKVESKIKALVYFESQLRAVTKPEMLSLPMQHIAQTLINQSNLTKWVMHENGYPNLLLPMATINSLAAIKQQFAKQFESNICRAAILQYLLELPLGFKNSDIVELIKMNSLFLERTKINKCLMYAMPGLMTTIETVHWAKDNISNIEIVDLGHAMHCAPITIPDQFSKLLSRFILSL